LHDLKEAAINHLINGTPLHNEATDSAGLQGCFAPKNLKKLKKSKI
jgi:hypothetical protein